MSVPEGERKEGKLKVITKANELSTYTLKICSNEKNFPKRYRWCITNKIVDSSLNINNYAIMANSIFVHNNDDFLLRRKYQTEAIAECNALLSMIDLAYRVFGIESDRVKYWVGLIKSVLDLLKKWKKSEEDKYKNIG